MKKLSTTITVLLLIFAATGFADLFRNRTTDEIFYGYALQKRIADKARVYVLQEDEKFKAITIDPAEYEITYDAKGRRNNVVVIPVKDQEILLSQRVSQFLGKTIIQASNKGPRYIILDIDLPGGHGDNMKIVCDDILNTTNCPIVAFISGGTFGGVFSSATAIPLACDKVYIAPDAMIGTVSTPIGTVLTQEQTDEYYQTFSPDSLSAYTTYVANIAERRSRPAIISAAMVNKNIDVIEVQIDESGKKDFIDRTQKIPSMKLLRNLSTGINAQTAAAIPSAYDDQSESSQESAGLKQLTLTSKQAVSTKIADKVVSSLKELVTVLNADQAKIATNTMLKRQVRNFLLNKNNMITLLTNIEFLENKANEIGQQITEIQKENRRGTVVRQRYSDQTQKAKYRGVFRTVLPKEPRDDRDSRRYRDYGIEGSRRSRWEDDDIVLETERIVAYQLNDELLAVLDELIANYSRVIGIATKYPSSLPVGMNIMTFRKSLDYAARQRDSLLF